MTVFYYFSTLLGGSIRDEHNEKTSTLHCSECQHYVRFHVPYKLFLDKKKDDLALVNGHATYNEYNIIKAFVMSSGRQ